MQQREALELPVTLVLHPTDLTLIVAELTHHEIDVSVAIEVRGLHIADPSDVLQEDTVAESLIAVVLEDEDCTHFVVVGEDGPHRGYEEIDVSVQVDVAGSDMRGRQNGGADRRFSINPRRVLTDPTDLVSLGIAKNDVLQSVAVEVDDSHVRDPRWRLSHGITDGSLLQKRERLSASVGGFVFPTIGASELGKVPAEWLSAPMGFPVEQGQRNSNDDGHRDENKGDGRSRKRHGYVTSRRRRPGTAGCERLAWGEV
jgi:hypothetical protein